MPLAHRIQSTAPLDDAFAQAFATRNERECDRPDSGLCILIVCLLVVAVLMIGAYAVAQVPGAQWVVGGLAVLGVADVWAKWCEEAKEAQVVR